MGAEKPTPPPIPRTRRPTLEIDPDELEEVDFIKETRRLTKDLIETPTVDLFEKEIPHDPAQLELRVLIRLHKLREGLPQMDYHQMKNVVETIREEIENAGITK